MFPTTFSLAHAGFGSSAADGTGGLFAANVGGSVIAPLTGHVADPSSSLGFSLIVQRGVLS
jgi:FHS family L-fucose permease-like MFS transporter